MKGTSEQLCDNGQDLKFSLNEWFVLDLNDLSQLQLLSVLAI